MGALYRGEFRGEWRDGFGCTEFPNKCKYSGEYREGRKNGVGVYAHADNSKYYGEFLNGTKHGVGIMETASGRRTFEQWDNDKREFMLPFMRKAYDASNTAHAALMKSAVDARVRPTAPTEVYAWASACAQACVCMRVSACGRVCAVCVNINAAYMAESPLCIRRIPCSADCADPGRCARERRRAREGKRSCCLSATAQPIHRLPMQRAVCRRSTCNRIDSSLRRSRQAAAT